MGEGDLELAALLRSDDRPDRRGIVFDLPGVGGPQDEGMRQRVVRVALTAALVAVVLVSPDYASGDPVELPSPPAGGRLGLYDTHLRLRAGSGPKTGGLVVRQALGARVAHGYSSDDLTVTVPVSHAEQVIGVVRASSPAHAVRERVVAVWAVLAGACALALTAAVLVARRQARVLATQLEDLSRHNRAVTAGDLSARAGPSGIAEIDQVARAHNEMLYKLTELLATNGTTPRTPRTSCAPR
ncbi:HAMP domain-containing protein [Streptomyces sp. NPDC001102]